MGKSAFAAGICAVAAAILVSGCTSSRFGNYPTYQPAPLDPAPSGQVTAGQLPPPTQPGQTANTQGNFPTAPGDDTGLTGDPNASDSSIQQVNTAGPVTRESLVGAWKVTTAGSSCQMFMALTKWTGGFRAASRGCPGDAASVAAWDVQGQQVVLSDSNGNKVASLFSSGSGSFNGQTNSGAAISLTR